ncbi:MAG: autotransporter-associated beta strand repeat-containing protein, partial [Patescibacteria group bacterium]|nr:autotransporter-associated beta strand repeat-containing protein [Patescibacteria group bacterium]
YTGRGGNQVAKTGAGTSLLTGNNTFTGTVAVNGGRLVMGHQNALGAATNALTLGNVAGATLSLGGYDLVIGSLAGGGATGGEVALGANRLTVGGANASSIYAGVISGTAGLTKTGTGTLTLSGTLGYTGETIVNGGVLVLNKDGGALGDGTTGQFASSGNLITVNSGATLRVNQSFALGDGKQHQVVVNGGTLDFNAGDNYQNSITLTGAAITTRATGLPWRTGYHAGNAMITVNGSNVSSTISGILCFVRTESGGPGTTTFNVADGAAELDLVVSSTIVDHSGLGGMVLVKDGAGTMVLGGASTYVGGTRIDGGTLRISADNNLGAAPASATAGHLVIAEGATLAVTRSFTLSATRGMTVGGTLDVAAGQTLTYNGIAAGTGGLTKTGTGTLTLGGASTFTGAVRVDQGVLKLGTGLALGPGDSAFGKVVVNTGGTVDLNGKGGGIYGFTIAGTGADGTGALVNTGSEIGTGLRQTSNIELSADAMVGGTGNFALLASGSAATTLDLDGFTLTKAGSNAFTVVNTTFTAGAIHVVGGTFAQHYRAHDAGMVAFTLDDTVGVSLDLGGYNLSVGSLAGGGTSGGNVALGANMLTVGGLGTSTSYAGAIAGTGGLIKTGTGTLTLSGANTFTGSVAINEGALAMAHGSALGAGTNAVTLADTAGAALSLGGYDLTLGSLAGGGTTGGNIALGANRLTVGGLGTSTAYAGAISGTGGLTKTGTGTLTLGGTLGYAGETIVDGGVLVLNKGGTLAADNTGQFTSAQTITVNAGATLRLTASWAMGDGKQHHLIANGGTIDFYSAENYQNFITLTGAAVTTAASGRPWRTGYFGGDALITVNESNVSSTISGLLCFVKSGSLGEKATFNVADGAAEHDLIVSSTISDHPPSGSTSYSGMVLAKTGPGTMVLSGANTFEGGVAVDAGTLLVNNTAGSGTGTGAVMVNSGGTLGGTGRINGATTVGSGATLATGASIGTLTFGSSLHLADGATWDWEFLNNTAGNYDQAVGPTLILPADGGGTIGLNITGLDGHSLQAGDRFTLFTGDVYQDTTLMSAGHDLTHLFTISDNTGWWGTWQVTAGSLVLTAVPEPGSWLLLLSALACGLLVRRR